ncbi:MAG: hypothetical protein N3E47_01220 [Candidatus Bathyarchaeota archaeon]|nr:hypothetical protein [Candidatus Bathyarchaeota archaeon]
MAKWKKFCASTIYSLNMKKIGILLAVIMIVSAVGGLAYFYLYRGGAIALRSIDLYIYPEMISEVETPINVAVSLDNNYPVNVRIKGGELKILADTLELGRASVPSQVIVRGLNTLMIDAVLNNTLIDEFWYQHLSRAEASVISLHGSLLFETPIGDVKVPVRYATNIETNIFPIEQKLNREYDLGILGKVIIREAKIELKSVTLHETHLKASIDVENHLRIVPLYIKGLVFNIRTGETTILGMGEQVGENAIAPGERDEILFDVTIDNSNIPKLWYEHIKNEERTVIYVELWLKTEIAGRTIELFRETPLTVSTKLETNIFKYRK